MKGFMRGIVKEKPDNSAVYREDIPIPQISASEVLVKVKAAAICGTDLHIMHWSQYAEERLKLPMVFGHEFAGDIVEIGGNVRDFKVGDRVAGETHIPCNDCYQCKTNNRHICENMKIIGINVPGAFCEYISVPQDCLFHIEDTISYITGAMLEPMGVAVHGVSAANVMDKNVLIYGCGPIGLMAVGAAKSLGAKRVFAGDVFDAKLDIALKMRADKVINSKNKDLVNIIREETAGIGCDVVIDYTGNKHAIKSGFDSLSKGGTYVMVGLPSSPVELDLANDIIYKEATVIGVTGRRMYETWDECIDILNDINFDITPVLGGTYNMKDFEGAFDALYNGAPGKMILIP